MSYLKIFEVLLLSATIVLSMLWVVFPSNNIEPWIVFCLSLLGFFEIIRQWMKRDRKMYLTNEGKKILMIQTFADRKEWGTTYHCTSPKQVLTKI